MNLNATKKDSKKGKRVVGKVKFNSVAAKGATPAPPLGPVLGQRGINIAEFCKTYNDKTSKVEPFFAGDADSAKLKLRASLLVYNDKSYVLDIKAPEVSVLIKHKTSISKGSGTTGAGVVHAILKKEDAMEIAEVKMNDMRVKDVSSAYKMVVGTAKSMGIKVE